MLYITKWMIENDLQINYSDRYDNEIKSGRVIEANYKEGDIIEEGTTVDITFSKGKLKMPKLTTLDEFKSWADTNGVKYEIIEEFNNDIAQGHIIKASVNTGKTINLDETITITVSKGAAISIPDFNGKTKNEAQKECDNLGLICSFTEETSTSKEGTIINQSISSGTEVAKGENITLTVATTKKVTTKQASTSSRPSPSRPANGGNNGGGSNNTGGSQTKPNPTPTCNTKTFNISPDQISIGNPTTTCNNIKSANPGYNINCNYVTSTSGKKGQVLNASSLQGITINSCNSVTVNIKNND